MVPRGETYKKIIYYWLPELISTLLLLTLPKILDSYLIGQLHSRSTFGALGVANNVLDLLTKLSESISVAAITIVGQYNGSKQYSKAGAALGDVFWTTVIAGVIPFCALFFFSTEIYLLMNVPHNMAVIGSPFLKLRAIGVLLTFVYLGFLGFMRGVKNTKTPMIIYIVGICVFLICDYTLVLGKFGFPQMGLVGGAISTIAQYSLMLTLAVIYIVRNPEYRKYFPQVFFTMFSKQGAMRILALSIPIMIDKASLSSSYVYLSRLINPLGKNAIASFIMIKDLQQLAFLPAIAFATVLTFLVSNSLGAKDIDGARNNIRKVMLLSLSGVALLLIVLSFFPRAIMQYFDPRSMFVPMAAAIFPYISVFVVFDLIQVIFASALRGAGDVRAVMWIRFVTCAAFFFPFSTFMSQIPIENEITKYIVIYSSIYITNALMCIGFYIRLRTKNWTQHLTDSTSLSSSAGPSEKAT